MNSFMFSSYAVKGSEVFGACGVEVHIWYFWGHVKERNHLENKNRGEDNGKVDLK